MSSIADRKVAPWQVSFWDETEKIAMSFGAGAKAGGVKVPSVTGGAGKSTTFKKPTLPAAPAPPTTTPTAKSNTGITALPTKAPGR